MLKFLETKIFNASRRLNYISGIALTAMMCIVFLNVILRMVWRPILGTYEFTAFLASVTISFALAHCAAQKGHVAISLFTDSLSRRAKGICEAIVGAIGTGFFAVMFWQSVKYGFVLRQAGEESMTLRISFYPFVFGVAFGFSHAGHYEFGVFLNSFKKVAK